MTVNLTLGGNEYVAHHTVVTAPEEKVELSFSSVCFAITELVVSVETSDGLYHYKTSAGSVDISRHCRRAGEVKLSCSLVVRGEVLKTWRIESLLVKEVPGGMLVISELEDFKNRMARMEAALLELANR